MGFLCDDCDMFFVTEGLAVIVCCYLGAVALWFEVVIRVNRLGVALIAWSLFFPSLAFFFVFVFCLSSFFK